MTNILSQAEIDELLNALNSGTEPESASQEDGEAAKAKVYDFRTANKFPKEQMRTLNFVFQNFAQLFSNQLTGMMRTTCECELLSVEELLFNEFNNSLPTPVILAVLKIPPMHGTHLLEVSPEAAYMLINRLLGGTKMGDSAKQFTEIEMTLVERVLKQMMSVFDDAWDKVFRVNTQIERIETSSQFTQIVALNEPMAVITLNLAIGEESGLISLGIPHSAIEPVSKQLNTRLMFTSTQEVHRSESQTEYLSERIRNTPIALTAYFDETPAMVVDIVNLQVGDVIRLNQKVDGPLLVKVQHIPKFHAKIGTSGAHYAVQIVDIIEEENEDESFAGGD